MLVVVVLVVVLVQIVSVVVMVVLVQVLELVNPDMVFSAHDHHGYLYTGERGSGRMAREVDKFDRRDTNAPFTLQTRSKDGQASLSSMVWEVVVPTCSYRMGVQVELLTRVARG